MLREECDAKRTMLLEKDLILPAALLTLANEIAWKADISRVMEQRAHADLFLRRLIQLALNRHHERQDAGVQRMSRQRTIELPNFVNGDLHGHRGAIAENLPQHVRHDGLGRFRRGRNSLFKIIEDTLNRFTSLCIAHGGGMILGFRLRRSFSLL